MSKSDYKFKTGVHTVLVTPFIKSTYNIDYEDLGKWFTYQETSDVDGLVLFGSTSESGTLSKVEKMQILKIVYEMNLSLPNPKFLTVGISGSNDVREVIEFAKASAQFCDAFMVTVPHYVKPPQEGIVQWFRYICTHFDVLSKPIIMYNIPGRACINMLPETMKKIYDMCPNVVAVKEASGSIEQMKEVMRLVPEIKLFSGDDGLISDVIKIGGVGVISVASNVIPTEIVELTRFCIKGEYEKAEIIKLESKLDDFLIALFCETNPIPVKFMLCQCGVFKSSTMRLPLIPLYEEKHQKVTCAMYFTGRYSGELSKDTTDDK